MENSKSIFREAFGRFGDSPFLKTIDFLIEFQEFDYSKSQVALEVGISRNTIEPIWEMFIKKDFIKLTRTIGRADLYRLNRADPTIQAMIEFDMKLAGIYAQKQLEASLCPV